MSAVNVTLLRCVDKMDDVQLRIGFILTALSQSSDWMDVTASSELHSTLMTIYKDVADVSKNVYAEVKKC